MANPLDTFPYPWHESDARELHTTLVQIYPSSKGALWVAAAVGLDTGMLFGDQAAFFLWKEVLEASATAGKTRPLVELVVDKNPTNPRRGFLAALIASQPAGVDRQPRDADNAPRFVKGTHEVSEPEALLFHDDLTLEIGRVGWLIGVLQRLQGLSPSVCRFTVASGASLQYGSGFRIADDLLLTNWHVLRMLGEPTKVTAEFGYEDDGKGGGLASTAVPCGVDTMVTDEDDDWGVVRVKEPLAAAIPIVKLSDAVAPATGDLAFIIQHPGGARKRLAYVRNQVTAVDDRVVHYLSDTQGGSSGSPVLNGDGKLIGLHHAGGTPQEVAGKPPISKNEGIRIERVVAGLKAKGIQA
jgi:S1-C subfamily serine protease